MCRPWRCRSRRGFGGDVTKGILEPGIAIVCAIRLGGLHDGGSEFIFADNLHDSLQRPGGNVRLPERLGVPIREGTIGFSI